MVGSSLHGLAGVAAESGQPEAGARLLGAAEGLAASLGAPAYPRDQPVRARALAALTAALGRSDSPLRGRRAGPSPLRRRLPRPRPSLRQSCIALNASRLRLRGGGSVMPPL